MADQIRAVIQRNDIAAKSWQSMPTIPALQSMDVGDGLTAIVTCSDPRNELTTYLSIKPGEFVIIRNAGGRITDDVLTSLELIGTVMPLHAYIIIHHTDCGVLFMTDDGVRSKLSERCPEHAHSIEHKTWNSYHDIGTDQSVHDDVAALKKWSFLPKGAVIGGYVFDVETGKLRELVVTEPKG